MCKLSSNCAWSLSCVGQDPFGLFHAAAMIVLMLVGLAHRKVLVAYQTDDCRHLHVAHLNSPQTALLVCQRHVPSVQYNFAHCFKQTCTGVASLSSQHERMRGIYECLKEDRGPLSIKGCRQICRRRSCGILASHLPCGPHKKFGACSTVLPTRSGGESGPAHCNVVAVRAMPGNCQQVRHSKHSKGDLG